MAVKIRLKRMGKIRAPFYRIVVADSRTKRDGRVIEEIGVYHPTRDPSVIEVDSDRAQYWLGVGAQPTEQVAALLKLTGDWGTFKGDKNAKSTVTFAEPKEEFRADAKKKPVLRPKAAKPVVEEKPAVEDVPEAPAEAPSAVGEEVTAVEDAPVVEEKPAVEDVLEAPAESPSAVGEEVTAVEDAPVVEEAPAAQQVPASDEAEQKPSE